MRFPDRQRHTLPLPPAMRERQPFLLDARSMLVVAPWAPKRVLADDEARLHATLARLDLDALPAAVCWCWPDRAPEPVQNVEPAWLAAWQRDRCVYRIDRESVG